MRVCTIILAGLLRVAVHGVSATPRAVVSGEDLGRCQDLTIEFRSNAADSSDDAASITHSNPSPWLRVS